MLDLISPVSLAARQLLRRPAFSALAVLTLALGTGAATAMFGIVDAVLLRPLPFREPGQLVALCETNASLGFCVASPPNVDDWSRQSRTLSSLGLGRSEPFMMRTGPRGQGVAGGVATPGLFRTLGVVPALGRLLVDEDLVPPGRKVVVLSHEMWQREFGGDSGILGRILDLDGKSHEIVGVLPSRLQVPHLEWVKLWAPLPFDPRDESNRRWRGFATFGRLAPGLTVKAAEAELRVIQSALAERYPDTNRGWSASVHPLLDSLVGPVRPTLLVFLGAVLILLLVACANVASLLIARGVRRSRELATHAALGASPAALFRLVAVESVLLSLVGGGAGLLVAVWASRGLLSLMPDRLPRLDGVRLDGRVAAFGLLLSIAVGLLASLAPALRARRLSVAETVKAVRHPSSGRSALGLRGGLVVAEIALAFLLAIGAGLLTRSFTALLRWEPGFDRTHLLTFWTYASQGKYPTVASVSALFSRVEDELRFLPGVASVGMMSLGPLSGSEETGEFVVEGTAGAEPRAARWFDMSASYFPTLGVALRQGRFFGADDRHGTPRVALVNESFARTYLVGGDPVTRRVRERNSPDSIEIVGVVADIPAFFPGSPPRPEIYWPYAQSPRWGSSFLIRTSGPPAALARSVEARLASIDPDLRPSNVATMEDLVDGALARPRFQMALLGVFSAIALALSTVGVYGVLSASVASRTHELGVRLALGATGGRVLRLVMREGLALAASGCLLGLAAAFAGSRLLDSLLHGVRSTDPLTYTVALGAVLTAAALACFVPARRASRVDPIEALRTE